MEGTPVQLPTTTHRILSARSLGSRRSVDGAGLRRLLAASVTLVAVFACAPSTAQPTQPAQPTDPSKPTQAVKPTAPPEAQATPTTSAVSKPTEPPKPGGNVDNRRQLILTQGCIACHTEIGRA